MSVSASKSADVLQKLQCLHDNLSRVIRGKSEVLEQLIVALLARGSVLLEDVPGVGKTTLAKTLAASVDISFQRVQCTPDLLPSDIFGFSVFHPKDSQFVFRPGPIFCNVLLLDEINRASPRTQSALLEAMAEEQVTVDGIRYPLEAPFMVLATQNPSSFQGTYPLPESQLDRFLFLLALDYPDADSEVDILYDQLDEHPLHQISAVLTKEELLECQSQVREVAVDRSVAHYLVEIVRQTRQDPRLELGSSPRGSLMLFRAAQAKAMLSGREFVLPDDVQRMSPLVLSHRVILSGATSLHYRESREVIEDLVRRVKVPV